MHLAEINCGWQRKQFGKHTECKPLLQLRINSKLTQNPQINYFQPHCQFSQPQNILLSSGWCRVVQQIFAIVEWYDEWWMIWWFDVTEMYFADHNVFVISLTFAIMILNACVYIHYVLMCQIPADPPATKHWFFLPKCFITVVR